MASTASTLSSVAEEEVLTETEQLDAQIQAASDEIAALQQRRSTLSAYLLGNPPEPLQQILDTPEPSTARIENSANKLDTLRNRYKVQQTASLRAIYRLCTAATTFQTRDPDPAAVDDGYVLGIRIEVFSSQTKEFLTPYYLLLNRPWRKSRSRDDYCLHRHTFPEFVPVKAICKKWLPPVRAEEDEDNVPKQDLQRLTKELRRHIVSYHRREDAVAKMGRDNAAYVSRITLPDPENLEAKAYLKDGSTMHLRLESNGKIQKVSAKDNVGRRLYALERRLKRMGRIEVISLDTS